MKMVKRTLIAIAVVGLLATTVNAALTEWYLGPSDKSYAVKVDGKETPTFRWPYTISYKALTICTIPIKMQVGMYVQVKECKDKKIVLTQVDCGDIGKGTGDFPCYLGCVNLDVRANFEVKMGFNLHKGDLIPNADAYYEGDSVVPGDGDYHPVKLCVKAWKAVIWKAAPGDEVDAGTIDVTVKPNI
jgi:hypothetical protein